MEIRIGKLFSLNYNFFFFFSSWDFPGVSGGKNYPAMQKTQIRSLSQEDPLEKAMATHSVFLSGEFHGQRNLEGYSPWDRRELDITERLTLSLSFALSCLIVVVQFLSRV